MPNIIQRNLKKSGVKVAKVKPKKKIKTKKSLLAVRSTPKVTLKHPKTSTPGYYNCLMNYAQQGFYDVQAGKKLKIHSCCKKCKLSAPSLNSERDKELVKLITSYKQVGASLGKLLKPL